MVKRRSSTGTPRKRKARAKPVEEEVVEQEVLDEEDFEDEEEDEAPAPPPKRRRRRRAKAAPEPEPEPEDEVEEAPKPKRRARKTRKVTPEPAPKPKRRRAAKAEAIPEPEEEVDEDAPQSASLGDLAMAIKALLDAGEAISIRKLGSEYIIAKYEPKAGDIKGQIKGRRKQAMKRAEFRAIAWTEDYVDFRKEWEGLSFEDKVKQAKKEKVAWDEHDDPRVNLIHLTLAYREEFGIEKWRPEYSTKEARDKLLYEGIEADEK